MAEEDLEHFRAGVLWAIGRLGSLCRDQVRGVIPEIVAALDNPDSQARGMAVWCLSALGQVDYVSARADLLSDEGPVEFYEERRLVHTTVNGLARRAMMDGEEPLIRREVQ